MNIMDNIRSAVSKHMEAKDAVLDSKNKSRKYADESNMLTRGEGVRAREAVEDEGEAGMGMEESDAAMADQAAIKPGDEPAPDDITAEEPSDDKPAPGIYKPKSATDPYRYEVTPDGAIRILKGGIGKSGKSNEGLVVDPGSAPYIAIMGQIKSGELGAIGTGSQNSDFEDEDNMISDEV